MCAVAARARALVQLTVEGHCVEFALPVCIVSIAGAGEDDTELWNYVSYGNDMAAVDDGEAIRGLPDMTGVRRACR